MRLLAGHNRSRLGNLLVGHGLIDLAPPGGGGAPAFDPLTLPGLQVWIESDDAATLTLDTYDYVSAIADKSGNAQHFTAVWKNAPAQGYKVGGRNAMYFSGAGNEDTNNGSLMRSDWLPTDDFWVAMYVQRGPQHNVGGSSLRPMFVTGDTSSTEISFGTRHGNTPAENTLYVSVANSAEQTTNDFFQTGDRAKVVFQYSKGNFARIYVDNVLVVDDTVNTSLSPAVCSYLGGSGFNSISARRFNGAISEMIGGNGILSPEDHSAIVDYFGKYQTGEDKSVWYDFTPTATFTDKDANQSVAAGSDFNFTASTSGAISDFMVTTWSADFSTSLQTYDTSADLPAMASGQTNGLYYDQAAHKLYATASNWNIAPNLSWLLIYDVNASTGALTFSARHDLGALWAEAATFYSGSWWVVYHNDHAIHQYDTDWSLIARHALPTSNPWSTIAGGGMLYQSIRFVGDIVYIGTHNGNPRKPQITAYHWTGSEFVGVLTGLKAPSDAGQGFDWDGSNAWFALRVGGDASVPSSVIKATPSARMMKVG